MKDEKKRKRAEDGEENTGNEKCGEKQKRDIEKRWKS